MKIASCDICCKPVLKWYRIEIGVESSSDKEDVGKMVKNIKNYDLCIECFKYCTRMIKEYKENTNE